MTESRPLVFSFSLFECYDICPHQCYRKYIAKDTEDLPMEPAHIEKRKWGDDVHKALQKGAEMGLPLSERFSMYQYILDAVAAVDGERLVENQLAVNAELEAADYYKPGDGGIRGKNDLAIMKGERIVAMDYKTGKKKITNQMQLMALLLFAKFPQVNVIHAAFLWLQTRKTTRETFKREQIPMLWEPFVELMREISWCKENNLWLKRQNGLCKAWCPVTECEFNGKFRRG